MLVVTVAVTRPSKSRCGSQRVAAGIHDQMPPPISTVVSRRASQCAVRPG